MLEQAIFDADLIRRYDHAGPRYTSYPTAVQFHAGFGEEAYRDAVATSGARAAPAPLSLYVHIPFCATICYYCACNKVVTRNRAHAGAYLDILCQEIARQGELFDPQRPVRQLHWGGGTPTFLDRNQRARLMAVLRRHFHFLDDDTGEYAIEIDPRTIDAAGIRALRALGFNRLSIGVQDFDRRVQRAVNRLQTEAETMGAIFAARAAGFRSIGIDLIYGLPAQTAASFERTVERVLVAAPDRISVFNYAHLPDLFKTQRQIDPLALPAPGEKLRILERTIARLTAAGYVYIGMDHFARPDDELARAQRDGRLTRNFQGYSAHGGCDVVGLGMSAIGSIGDCHAQNERSLDAYRERIAAGGLAIAKGVVASAEDKLRRDVINALACHCAVDIAAIEAQHGIAFWSHFATAHAALVPMRDDGLVSWDACTLRVLPRGRFLLRNICMAFDAYLGAGAHGAPRYSKVI